MNLNEICANCGCTYGSHHAGHTPWPYNYCPRQEWENGPGTVFRPFTADENSSQETPLATQ